MSTAALACCGDTAFSLQHDVERHQIGPLRLHQRICGSRVPGLTNHFDVAATLQRGDENLSEQNMIVHHQHTHEYPPHDAIASGRRINPSIEASSASHCLSAHEMYVVRMSQRDCLTASSRLRIPPSCGNSCSARR